MEKGQPRGWVSTLQAVCGTIVCWGLGGCTQVTLQAFGATPHEVRNDHPYDRQSVGFYDRLLD